MCKIYVYMDLDTSVYVKVRMFLSYPSQECFHYTEPSLAIDERTEMFTFAVSKGLCSGKAKRDVNKRFSFKIYSAGPRNFHVLI